MSGEGTHIVKSFIDQRTGFYGGLPPYSYKLLDQFRLKFWFDWTYEDDPYGEQESFGVYGNEITWFSEVYRTAFRDAAQDEERFLIMNRESARTLAPHDGGFDCFMQDSNEATGLAHEFRDWLSPLRLAT